jgi:HNH endonuclease
MAKFPKYKIDPDSEVKGTGAGEYTYVTTTPDYEGPGVKKMPDHKKTYVPLHRLKKEMALGRYLRKNEFVHHENEDKSDASPSNLKLTDRWEHGREHAEKGNKFWKKSPLNKPHKKSKKAMAQNVVSGYLQNNEL